MAADLNLIGAGFVMVCVCASASVFYPVVQPENPAGTIKQGLQRKLRDKSILLLCVFAEGQ